MKKKIAAIGFGGLNGATQVALNVLVNLKASADEKIFLFYGQTTDTTASFLHELDSRNIDWVQVFKKKSGMDFSANMELYKHLLKYRPANIVLSSRAPVIAVVMYKIRHPKTNIVSIEQQPLNHFEKKEYVQGVLSLLFFNKLVPPSKAYMDGYIDEFNPLSNFFKHKIYPIANGLPQIGKSLDAVKNISRSGVTIGMAARFEKGKDFDTLIRAIKLLQVRDGDTFKVLLAGDGTLRAQSEKLVRDLHLSDKIEFLGLLDKQGMERSFYSRIDAYVQSSSGEAMSVSMIESMAHGLIFIGTKVRGIQDFIQPGVNGLLFEYGNESDLAFQLTRLLDQQLVSNLKKGAQNYYDTHFSLSKMVSEYEKLID